jgi:hypothetical protein
MAVRVPSLQHLAALSLADMTQQGEFSVACDGG